MGIVEEARNLLFAISTLEERCCALQVDLECRTAELKIVATDNESLLAFVVKQNEGIKIRATEVVNLQAVLEKSWFENTVLRKHVHRLASRVKSVQNGISSIVSDDGRGDLAARAHAKNNT